MRANTFARTLLRDSRGATAVEYGLIVSLVVIAALGAMQTFGNESFKMWTKVGTAIDDVM